MLDLTEEFAEHVDRVLRPGGYRILAAFDPEHEQADAVAGFRACHSLAWGHHLYVDDLSALPEARRRVHGRALLDRRLEEARRLGCGQPHLDSGVDVERSDAYRLFLNCGHCHLRTRLRAAGRLTREGDGPST